MPIFEFECLKCGTWFERLVPRAGRSIPLKCPNCGSSEVEQKVSSFSSPGGDRSTRCAPSGG